MIVKKEPRPELQKISLWLPLELLEELDSLANREGVGRTALMIGLLRYALHKKETNAVIEVTELRRKTKR